MSNRFNLAKPVAKGTTVKKVTQSDLKSKTYQKIVVDRTCLVNNLSTAGNNLVDMDAVIYEAVKCSNIPQLQQTSSTTTATTEPVQQTTTASTEPVQQTTTASTTSTAVTVPPTEGFSEETCSANATNWLMILLLILIVYYLYNKKYSQTQ